MSKVDISVSRTLTINTGNYESIKPSVSITVKDVDITNTADVYLTLDDALTGLLQLEILNCSNEKEEVNDGLSQYCKVVEDNIVSIGDNIEKALIKMSEI